MLHGLRFTEPLGLQVRDVIRRGDTWVFCIRPNKFRSLKTPETERELPIHPRLIELGLLDLTKGREAEDLLIPGTPVGEGKAFNAAQKQMGRVIRKLSPDRRITYHSLRHSFRDAMQDNEFPPGVEERLGGWKINAGSAMAGYGRGGPKLEQLSNWIGKIAYEGVEID